MYFDRSNPSHLLQLLDTFLADVQHKANSLVVHVGGTREHSEKEKIKNISSFIIDVAVKKDIPIIPVLFKGGLPEEDMGQKYEYPYNFGKQEIIIGNKLNKSDFLSLNSVERSKKFLDKLYELEGLHTIQKRDTSNKFENNIKLIMENFNLSQLGVICIQSLKELKSRQGLSNETNVMLDQLLNPGHLESKEVTTLRTMFKKGK